MSDYLGNGMPETWYVLGNPGSGKSTLLNGLCSNEQFEAGVSVGNGLTAKQKRLVVKLCGRDVELVDTPGLGDLTNQKECAKVVTTALKGSQCCKLFFVVKLVSGRMQGADVAVMHAILAALDAAVQSGPQYVVVLNAVNEKKLSNKNKQWRTELYAKLCMLAEGAGLPSPAHVLTFPYFDDAHDEDNYVLGQSDTETFALRQLQVEMFASPSNNVVTSRVKDVEMDEDRLRAANAKLEEAEEQLKKNTEEVAKMHEKLQKAEDEHKAQMAELVGKLEANEGQIRSLEEDLKKAKASQGGWWSFIPIVGQVVDMIRAG